MSKITNADVEIWVESCRKLVTAYDAKKITIERLRANVDRKFIEECTRQTGWVWVSCLALSRQQKVRMLKTEYYCNLMLVFLFSWSGAFFVFVIPESGFYGFLMMGLSCFPVIDTLERKYGIFNG